MGACGFPRLTGTSVQGGEEARREKVNKMMGGLLADSQEIKLRAPADL